MHHTSLDSSIQPGFVLAELVLVLTLLAGLAVATLPTLNYWLARDRVDTQAQALLMTLAYARSEAIKRGIPIAVCRADSAAGCGVAAQDCRANPHGALANEWDWGCGYAVFAKAKPGELENAAQLLRMQAPVEDVAIKIKSPRLWFAPPAGQVMGGLRRFELSMRSMENHGQDERLQRCVLIAVGGRARLANGPCKAL